ncbi:alpha/beta hydrolase [Streptomyces sp. NBC_01232]|uniref:alpha/beta hydrolase n=1 Tax=Streptomyces sp. NBC_01232 TaxID=2903786 RepID=UPI002E11F3B7|nr:alpha/beta hydrolase [Streptomyces sp. NBC_01232]WSQ03137.1 alpha/beta hydrolase [Streptomyces sp. NBC_01232]
MLTRLADDNRRRVVWGISLLLIAVTALLGSAPGSAGAARAAGGGGVSGGGAVPVPVLSWGPCDGAGDGFGCATARVPLDYRRPAGPALSLAVTRRPAAGPAHRTGVLVLHPGGPGNSGVNFARSSYGALPASLRDAFDVVGYDMRGVARSGQVECWNDQEYTAAVDGARGVPGPGAVQEAVRQGLDFARACRERSGDLVPFIGTGSNARDIDLLRRALGEETLSFYGRSFGSYVGTVYAAQFPRRVRAMVLDGGYDPRRYADVPYAYDGGQFAALDAAVGRFLNWCGHDAAVCGFGEGRPRQAFEQLKRDLDADPVITASGRPATGYTLAYRLMFSINSGREIWPDLGQALKAAQERRGSFLLSPPSPASFDFLSVNTAVECADRLYPGSRLLLGATVGAEAAAAPLLGPPIGLGPPAYDHNHAPACAQWPAQRPSRFTGSYRAAGSAPILVLGTTGDPDTPYRDAVALAGTLEGGRLLTFAGEGHTAYNRSACVSALVTDYLATLALPARGTVCADEAGPEPAGRRTTGIEADETQDVIPALR